MPKDDLPCHSAFRLRSWGHVIPEGVLDSIDKIADLGDHISDDTVLELTYRPLVLDYAPQDVQEPTIHMAAGQSAMLTWARSGGAGTRAGIAKNKVEKAAPIAHLISSLLVFTRHALNGFAIITPYPLEVYDPTEGKIDGVKGIEWHCTVPADGCMENLYTGAEFKGPSQLATFYQFIGRLSHITGKSEEEIMEVHWIQKLFSATGAAKMKGDLVHMFGAAPNWAALATGGGLIADVPQCFAQKPMQADQVKKKTLRSPSLSDKASSTKSDAVDNIHVNHARSRKRGANRMDAILESPPAKRAHEEETFSVAVKLGSAEAKTWEMKASECIGKVVTGFKANTSQHIDFYLADEKFNKLTKGAKRRAVSLFASDQVEDVFEKYETHAPATDDLKEIFVLLVKS